MSREQTEIFSSRMPKSVKDKARKRSKALLGVENLSAYVNYLIEKDWKENTHKTHKS